METFYHIFQVSDYKGGELHHTTNLTKEEFHQELMYMFDLYDSFKKDITVTANDIWESIPESDYYAGGYDSLVYKFFQTKENGELENADIDYVLLAKWVNEYNHKDE